VAIFLLVLFVSVNCVTVILFESPIQRPNVNVRFPYFYTLLRNFFLLMSSIPCLSVQSNLMFVYAIIVIRCLIQILINSFYECFTGSRPCTNPNVLDGHTSSQFALISMALLSFYLSGRNSYSDRDINILVASSPVVWMFFFLCFMSLVNNKLLISASLMLF
jgi:hypothetical protein